MNSLYIRWWVGFLGSLLLWSSWGTSVWAMPAGVAEESVVEKAPLVLAQGEQRLLRLKGLVRFSIGGSAIRAHTLTRALASLSKRSSDLVLIKGVAPGVADLWVWKKDHSTEHRSIRVERSVSSEAQPALEKALGKLEELEVYYSGSGAVLHGEVQSLDEARRLSGLLKTFGKEIKNETEVSQELFEQGKARLAKWIQRSGLTESLRLETLGRVLWVRGHLSSKAEASVAERQILAQYPLSELDIESLPDRAPTVYFTVYLLELKKDRFSQLGLNWPTLQSGAFRVTTAAIQDLLSLDVTLDAFEADGSMKILSNPELVVRAPGEAELFAGGELPIHSESHFYSSYSWKPFGLTLKLNVSHTAGNRVRLDIFTEVSRLDPTLSLDGKIPALQSNRMKTQVDAEFGVPLFLSGLLEENIRDQVKGLPLLKSIPILGKLFGSEDYMNHRSELVAILLPRSSPPSAPMEKLKRLYPRGPIPIPRDWVSPEDEKALKESPDYPWNVLR